MGSAKTDVLLNFIKYQQPDVDKIYLFIYLCTKDPFKLNHQLLTNRREKAGNEQLKNSNASTDYSQASDECLWKIKGL